MSEAAVGVRWTVGDVSERGFEALRLSLWGAQRVFGPEAGYIVCVNTVPLDRARALTGDMPANVVWHDATADVPTFLRPRLDAQMAEGVAWKLAPLRCFPDRYEVSLDNDCILWEMPEGMRAWIEEGDPGRCLLAEDARAMFGRFAPFCGEEPRNAGIRGLPPGFDLEAALRDLLARIDGVFDSELDEQGLQVAALSRQSEPRVVSIDDVTICSPFWPHRPYLGRCGAHFVGLNQRHYPWSLDGRPAEEHIKDNWQALRSDLYARVGISMPAASA